MLKVLVGCEESQVVCEEFLKLGHDAYSCDIIPTSGNRPDRHLQMDIYDALSLKEWDMGIFFTPCTYSCNSGVRWLAKDGKIINQQRYEQMKIYTKMLRDCLNSMKFTACENPIPHRYALGEIGRKYDQTIQHWQFGHGETKRTCLWLNNLPHLIPTNIVSGREARIHKMAPGPERSKERSKTYPGIAKAMASQWSEYVLKNI